MRLTLRYEPVPENAPLFAADIVAKTEPVSEQELDYSPGSLREVDALIEGLRREGAPVHAVASTLFGFGCYVGEVMVRNAGGRWGERDPEDRDVVGWRLVIRLPDNGWTNPIGRVFRRYENGEVDSVVHFYELTLSR